MARYNVSFDDFIAAITQAASDKTIIVKDAPDDKTQRRVGKYIAENLGYYASSSTNLVEKAAKENNLY